MLHYSERSKKTAVGIAGGLMLIAIMITAGVMYWREPEFLNGLAYGLGIGFLVAFLLPGGFLAKHMMKSEEEMEGVQPKQQQKLIEYITDKHVTNKA